MRSLDTPSIFLQRIILVVLVAVVGCLAWWQNVDGNSEYFVQKFSKTSVPTGVDTLDFTMAEVAWSNLQIDSQGNLQIDAMTESALLDAITLMNDEPSTARMAFLLEKQFGATASAQVMALLPKLKTYKDSEQRWLAANANVDPLPHEGLFQLQDEIFGTTLAERMFSEQRRLAKLMLASHKIQNDAGLTPAEKDQALLNLHRAMEPAGE